MDLSPLEARFALTSLWLCLALGACGHSEWVHPTKPKGAFAQEYSRCESRVYQDPQMQTGMKMMLQEGIERCLHAQGWMLVEKP